MPTAEHVVIAAAGFGSRLGRGHPKCLLELGGRTLLDRQLELVADVPDVRVVVGFQEADVVKEARRCRPDVIIVRNAAYASTSTIVSYALGARHLQEPCLFMDGDILFDGPSFESFLEQATSDLLVGYTQTKTLDAVYVTVQDGLVTGFSRTERSGYEWANLALLPSGYCEGSFGAVFERLGQDLPLAGWEIESYEVDRPEDLVIAEQAMLATAGRTR